MEVRAGHEASTHTAPKVQTFIQTAKENYENYLWTQRIFINWLKRQKNDIKKEVYDRLPRKVDVIAVNHFKQNFRDGGRKNAQRRVLVPALLLP